jgi:hypothetical protein
MEIYVTQDSGLNAGKRKEEVRIESGDGRGFGSLGARGFAAKMKFGLDLRKGEGDSAGISILSKGVDPWATWIAETKKLGDFVVGFACGIVYGTADERVVPGAIGKAGEIEMCVAP